MNYKSIKFATNTMPIFIIQYHFDKKSNPSFAAIFDRTCLLLFKAVLFLVKGDAKATKAVLFLIKGDAKAIQAVLFLIKGDAKAIKGRAIAIKERFLLIFEEMRG